MTDSGTDHDSITVLLCADDAFVRAAESHLTGEWDGTEVLGARTHEDALALLGDRDVDCVVYDDAITDDGEAFASRIRSDYPHLPFVLRTDRTPTAGDPAVLAGGHTDVLWRREGDDALGELAARIATVVAAARNDVAGGRARRATDTTGGKSRRASDATDGQASDATDSQASDATDGQVAQESNQADKIEALHEAATDIVTCHTEAKVYERTVAAAERVLEFDVCCTMVYDDGMLVPKAVSSGAPPDGARPMRPDEGEAGQVYQTGVPHFSDDTSEDDVAEPAKDSYRSGMSVPIGDAGVFQAVSNEPGDFTETDVELAELLLSHTEAALERIEFEETLRQQQRELRRQNERLDEFASVVSHDLRNPLNVAQGYAELIEDADSAEEAAEFTAEIGASLDRMETLVEDVLALARQGRTIGDPEPVDLRAVTEVAWENVETGDADLVVAEDVTFLADESRLVQLLENLVRNAMEHGNADRLRVGPIRTDDDVAGFSIDDDGSGIPQGRREQVFDLGFTTENEGAGLGLAIVEQIAEAHGWTVSVSESEAGGARFEFGGVEAE